MPLGHEIGERIAASLGGNATHGGGYPAGAGVPHDDDDDFRGTAEAASRHAGSSDSSFFTSVVQSLVQKKKHGGYDEDIDEESAVRHHKKYFGDTDDGEQPDHNSIGNAAAVQALKMFAGGHGGGDESKSQSQSQFIALAMGEASKLFDQQSSQGKVSGDSSSKESAIAKAGEVALKMYLKNQGGGGGGGGSSGGLLSLASKFL